MTSVYDWKYTLWLCASWMECPFLTLWLKVAWGPGPPLGQKRRMSASTNFSQHRALLLFIWIIFATKSHQTIQWHFSWSAHKAYKKLWRNTQEINDCTKYNSCLPRRRRRHFVSWRYDVMTQQNIFFENFSEYFLYFLFFLLQLLHANHANQCETVCILMQILMIYKYLERGDKNERDHSLKFSRKIFCYVIMSCCKMT